MKKSLFLAALCALTAASMTTAAAAEARATAPEATTKPIIDGVIDEIWSSAEKMYGGIYGDTKDGAENLKIVSSYGSLLWSEEGLYLLGVMYDATIPAEGVDVDARNSIDFWVSEMNTQDTAYAADGDWHYCKASTGEEAYYTGNETVYDEATTAVVVYDDHFVVEIFCPWQTEGFLPAVGTEIGYTISFNDDVDVDGVRDICSLWAVNSGVSYAFYAETQALPTVAFVEGPAVETEDPTAEPVPADPEIPVDTAPAEEPADVPAETVPHTADAGILAAAAVMAAAAGVVLTKKR